MPFIRAPLAQIEYEAHGPPEHLALILLHGFPDSFRTWDGVIDNLKGERLRILVPHLRGFGGTHVHHPEALSGQTAALAQDVLDFADSLAIDRFVLVGHDWGARTAYSVAVLAPQRIMGLVALSTPYLMFQGKRESPEQVRAYWYQWYFNTDRGRALSRPIPFPSANIFGPRGRPNGNSREPNWRPRSLPGTIRNLSRSSSPTTDIATETPPALPLTSGSKPNSTPSPAPPCHQVQVPLLFGCGLADAVNLPASSQGQELWFPRGYERIEFPNVGHFPQREVPDDVAQLIRRVLARKRLIPALHGKLKAST